MSAATILVTMGDPAGVGPEVALAATAKAAAEGIPCRIIGSRDLLNKVAKATNRPLAVEVQEPENHPLEVEAIAPGTISGAAGGFSLACVTLAAQACLNHKAAAMVTAPICKEAVSKAGHEIPGHTEYLARLAGMADDDVVMCLTAPALTVALTTCHQSLLSVPDSLSAERIKRTATLLNEYLQARHTEPRLACCGFNPHAGENGMFGSEDEAIATVCTDLRASGLNISDPLPPDTAFTPRNRQRFDGYVCMYHDQALIPFKALCFDSGVNTSLGLPFIRTSSDHGTAFDIAWQGLADPASTYEAIVLAKDLAARSNG